MSDPTGLGPQFSTRFTSFRIDHGTLLRRNRSTAVNIEARLATDEDLRPLCRAADSAVREKLQQRGGPLWSLVEAPEPPLGSALRRLLVEHDSLLAVGTIDDVVVGFAAATLKQPHDDGRPIADLQGLFVEPEARGVGVGEALMDVVVDWAVCEQCQGIDSFALPGDRATKNFFESFGLVARAIKVHRAL